MTLQLAFCSFAIGMVIGLIGAGAKLSSIKILKFFAEVYTTVIRGTPELLIIFLIFFGGQLLLSLVMGRFVEVKPFIAGVFALSAVFGGYCTEVFRSAFQSIPKGFIEAGQSVGMTPFVLFRRISWPLVLRFSIPALGNLWLVMLKETALISVVGLNDIMRNTQIAVSNTKQPFLFFFYAALMYLCLTFISSMGFKGLEKSLNPQAVK